MKKALAVLIALVLTVGGASVAPATTITFDEFPATDNNAALTSAYAGLGVVFDGHNAGTWEGIAQGDPGNWKLNGTNGPQFLGNNGEGSYKQSIDFTNGATSISFDASRGYGSSAGQTLTANFYDDSDDLLDSQIQTLGNINTWSTFSLAVPTLPALT